MSDNEIENNEPKRPVGRPQSQARSTIVRRIRRGAATGQVWSLSDFTDLGSRHAIERIMQRLVEARDIQAIGRGLFFLPRKNPLTGRLTSPGAEAIVQAIARRDGLRLVGDGMSAANVLGLGTGVGAQSVWFADRAREPLSLGNQRIEIRQAPSWLLKWQGRRAGIVVNALAFNESAYRTGSGWNTAECQAGLDRLRQVAGSEEGAGLTTDLRQGFAGLPLWMQDFLRPLLNPDAQPAWTNELPIDHDETPEEGPRP
ncbi:DUF6088 family protein [Bosea sp. RAC05]|uniref:DUF6088 family protein n=1 Tax=Bosea sp. RAC05 TaxID=1842539 RepID=UPI0008564903|nr:DUF6088 family protein [Bosea sp. RAC05]AOG03214.1 hypothetical protein BSY19_4829 [Bosea sp. RAC05]